MDIQRQSAGQFGLHTRSDVGLMDVDELHVLAPNGGVELKLCLTISTTNSTALITALDQPARKNSFTV